MLNYYKLILYFNSCIFYTLQLLRKCILNMSKPTVEGPLGNPPFEKPSIAKVTLKRTINPQSLY